MRLKIFSTQKTHSFQEGFQRQAEHHLTTPSSWLTDTSAGAFMGHHNIASPPKTDLNGGRAVMEMVTQDGSRCLR